MSPFRHADVANPVPLAGGTDPSSETWSRTLVFVFTILLAGAGAIARAQSTDNEYGVKAAFLFHFAQLVDWPPETSYGADNSLLLCTFGEDPFGGALESTVNGKAIGTRVIRIRHLKQAEDMRECQILFLGKSEGAHIATLLTLLRNAPILTVGETPGFLGAGGMICFRMVKNQVRFDVNLDAAQSAKLKIGSRLLLLAQIVIGQSQEK